MKKHLLALFVMMFLLPMCKEKASQSNYIDTYYIPTSLMASVRQSSDSIKHIRVSVEHDVAKDYHRLSSEVANRDMFNTYSEYYNDTNYQRYDDDGEYGSASCNPLSSISVTCDNDWNASHPVGTSLNDIIYVEVRSYHAFLQSNYSKHELVCAMLPKLDYAAIPPFADWFDISFTSKPAVAGKYKLTINVKFGADPITGKIVEVPPVTVEVDF